MKDLEKKDFLNDEEQKKDNEELLNSELNEVEGGKESPSTACDTDCVICTTNLI